MVTTYPAGGGKTVTITHSDASTSIRSTFADGQVASISGTAVIAKSYDYGTHALNGGGTWSQTTAANATEWVKSYSDNLGRTFRTEFPDSSAATTTYYLTTATPGSRGKLASSTDLDNITTSYGYDTEGDLSQTTEPMPANQQRITLIGNDIVNDPDIGTATRRTTTVNGILVATSLSQAIGNASKSITLSGTTTSIRSAPADGAWTITTTAADGISSRAFYSDGLMKASTTFQAGATLPATAPANITAVTTAGFLYGSSATQDAFGRTLTQTDSRTGTTTMGLILENGSYASITEPGNRTTAFTYDVMARTIATELPDNTVTYTSHTTRGEVQAQWGSQTYPTFRTYDSQGRLAILRTRPTLDGSGKPTDAGGSLTTWVYHPQRGWLTGKRDAADRGADYTYTAAGRLFTRTWERGITTTYNYDAGLLTLTDYSDSTPDVIQTYDNFGRPLETSNTVSKTLHAYDPATLQLDTETISLDLNSDGTPELTRVLDRAQDNLLRPTGFQLLNGTTLENQATYTYSPADGRIATISGGGLQPPSPANTFTYGYQANSSNLIKTLTAPAHTVTNSWETTRDVLSNKENKAGSTIVSNYAYLVNSIGQRTDLTQTGSAFTAARSIAWGYDTLGQVTSADSTIPGLDRSYLFDTIGNRLKSADNLTLPTANNYIVNNLNQYTSLTINPQLPTLNPIHDFDGNMTSGPLPAAPGSNNALTWDAENRLISTTVGTSTTTYQYDSQSRRIARSVGVSPISSSIIYLYDAWNPIAEYSYSSTAQLSTTNPQLLKTRLWGTDLSGTLQGAGGVGGLLSETQISNSQISNFFPTYDGNGNVSEYLDATGTVAAHYEYDPFGRTTVATGPRAQDFTHRFSTKPLDTETGLYYYGYRYYDPLTGRWPSRDPIEEEGGINLYGFVENDGINWFDILGNGKSRGGGRQDEFKNDSSADLQEKHDNLKNDRTKEGKAQRKKIEREQKNRDERNKGKQRGGRVRVPAPPAIAALLLSLRQSGIDLLDPDFWGDPTTDENGECPSGWVPEPQFDDGKGNKACPDKKGRKCVKEGSIA